MFKLVVNSRRPEGGAVQLGCGFSVLVGHSDINSDHWQSGISSGVGLSSWAERRMRS